MLAEYFRKQLKSSRRRPCDRPSAAVTTDLLETRQLLSAVTVQVSASKDNTIYQSDPDASNGSGEFLLAGSGVRGLVQFDVGVPSGSTIIDAVLTLNATNSNSGGSSVSVHKVTSAWGESGSNATGDESSGDQARQFDATWIYSSFDGELWDSAGGDFGGSSASSSVSGAGAYEWVGGNLIDDIQSWIDNPSENFGWLLQAAGALTSFISKDAPDASLAPTLEITYEEPPLPPITLEGRIWNDLNSDGMKSDSTTSDLDLTIVNGNTYFNAFGGDEYWFRSETDSSWYYLTSDGALTKWSGVGGTLSGEFTATLDPRYYQDPTQVTRDSSGPDEPWLDGWTVELLNSAGVVVNSAVTGGRDINGNGVTDPDTEGGWYSFLAPADEIYTVRTVIPDGWAKTGEVTLTSTEAEESGVTNLNLRFRNSYYENFGGQNERWMFSDDTGWYYITPVGALYRWNGQAVSENNPLDGTFVAAPGTSYYDDPLTLADGFTEPGDGSDSTDEVIRTDIGVAEAHTVTGRVWLDFYPNGIKDVRGLIPDYYVLNPVDPIGASEEWFFDYENSDWYIISADGEANYWGPHEGDGGGPINRPGTGGGVFREFAEYTIEPWLNGRTVELVDAEGNVVATTTSMNVDKNGDGQIQLGTERGWYVFEDVAAGDYTVRTGAEAGWRQTAPATTEQTTATSLDNQFDFRTTASDFYNWGGENERWIIDQTNQWYYVLPDGSLHSWTVGSGPSNGGLQGTLIAQFTSAYHADVTLITAPPPAAATLRVGPDEAAIELLFGSHRILDELP